MTTTEPTITLTVPAIQPEYHMDEGLARQELEGISLQYVTAAQEFAQSAFTASQGLDWDNPEHVARLEASEQATRAYHTLHYVHQQIFGSAGLPRAVRPAHLPTPVTHALSAPYAPTVIEPSDEADRL